MTKKQKISTTDFKGYQPLVKHVRRGVDVARALDEKTDSLPHALQFTSLEFGNFMSELTPKRFQILRLSKGGNRSIAELAVVTQRDQSAVSKDVSRLKKLGLVTVVDTLNPGHGIKKVVQPIAENILIQASLT
ncbi:hypothetical protein B9Z39_13845 [Limnohabitans sp. JirII-29]|uniref:HVO_A0114 family putative DNA-binding protein n=1 Tax=unclassified Limnohabitans TaxID=2626134 RepID=UPI000C1F4C10|nr:MULTISPECIES: MarR family transcriptional regulator [unclassified Limnohabitans]PIT73855.1 hypothetical protein B9Z41_14245 [Limnohabitans sp. JirII-31]PUE24081.1 hypothetical protein B9Z39_13845 [Limnohabitans sp. JirII-29]